MAELENKKKKEKVPVTVPKQEKKVEQEELPEKVPEPGKRWEIPQRWHTY